MERRAKVELFEQIRREYEFGVGTVLGSGAQAGSASADGAPGVGERGAAGAPEAVERERPVIEPLRPFIDAILEADRNAPRKQRHTAHRIYATDQDASYQTTGWRRSTVRRVRARTQTANWAGRRARPACRRATRRGRKARSIGTRRGRS